MAEERSISPSAQPPVGTGETAKDELEHLFSLPLGEQVHALKALVPRILGRLQEPGREAFIRSLREVPRGEAKVSRPPSPERPKSVHDVVSGILRQPLGVQQHILHVAAPRIAADLEGTDRSGFLAELENALQLIDQGELAEPVP